MLSTSMLQFRSITTQKRFIPQIDGLRFVAIASVVSFHIYAAFENEYDEKRTPGRLRERFGASLDC